MDQSDCRDLLGESEKIRKIREDVRRVAKCQANLLILGESGVGKEVLVQTIHRNGIRPSAPFVTVNCAAIPEELLESELFGHAKGAFTGAIQGRKGLFQQAEGGTLFLDEIGDMSLGLQAKLLRALQERKVRPVGDNLEREVHVRVAAATHRNLPALIKSGLFRLDLYYRLNVIQIEIPPLRQRPEDIRLLANHFLAKFGDRYSRKGMVLSEEVLRFLESLPWPGNVRELENVIERAVILTSRREIRIGDLIVESNMGNGPAIPEGQNTLSLKEMELRYIQHVLERNQGQKEKAARILGIDRTTLHRKLAAHRTH